MRLQPFVHAGLFYLLHSKIREMFQHNIEISLLIIIQLKFSFQKDEVQYITCKVKTFWTCQVWPSLLRVCYHGHTWTSLCIHWCEIGGYCKQCIYSRVIHFNLLLKCCVRLFSGFIVCTSLWTVLTLQETTQWLLLAPLYGQHSPHRRPQCHSNDEMLLC